MYDNGNFPCPLDLRRTMCHGIIPSRIALMCLIKSNVIKHRLLIMRQLWGMIIGTFGTQARFRGE